MKRISLILVSLFFIIICLPVLSQDSHLIYRRYNTNKTALDSKIDHRYEAVAKLKSSSEFFLPSGFFLLKRRIKV